MASFDYNYQNPSVFCFLVLIRAICSLLSTGITKFEFEKENKMNSGSCSQMTPSRKWPIDKNMYILLTLLQIYRMELLGRICLTPITSMYDQVINVVSWKS